MKTVAVVPVKRLAEAKARLAGALTPQERMELARKMLRHVLDTLLASGHIEKVAVISPNAGELNLPLDIIEVAQERQGLNNSLEQGRQWAIEEAADVLLVIFADLPLLSTTDIESLIEAGTEPGTVVLAPDRHGQGTNAILAHPPSLAQFHFGPHSYSRHLRAARDTGAHVVTYNSPGTSLDIDTPDDLREVT